MRPIICAIILILLSGHSTSTLKGQSRNSFPLSPAEQIFRQGLKITLDGGDTNKAILYFLEALKRDPEHLYASLMLAENLLKNGMVNEGKTQLKRHIKKFPRHHEAYTKIGNLLRSEKEYKKSNKYFLKALALEPGEWILQYGIASNYDLLGDKKNAIKYWVKFLQQQPEDAEASGQVGRCYAELGLKKEALKWLKKSLLLDPLNAVFPKILLAELLKIKPSYPPEALFKKIPGLINNLNFLNDIVEHYKKRGDKKKVGIFLSVILIKQIKSVEEHKHSEAFIRMALINRMKNIISELEKLDPKNPVLIKAKKRKDLLTVK
ncbi:tetratricopeptide repeat protein [Candidatus Riflebacteria bacterium]